MELGQLFKDLVWDAIIRALISRLFAAVPFLGWGPIGMLVSWGITYFADKIFEAIKLYINLEMIVLRNAQHLAAFQRAGSELYLIARDHGVDSEEFRRSREAHKSALAAYVKFN